MPALGMAQETGTLLAWLKREGDAVQKGEPLMTVATDKTDVEIEATASGILRRVTLREGEDAAVGQIIAWIAAADEVLPGEPTAQSAPPANVQAPSTPAAPVAEPPAKAPVSIAATPVAARMAAEHHIDLRQVPAGGDRIQKEDVLAYLAAQEQPAIAPAIAEAGSGRVLASPKARRLAQEHGLTLAAITGSGPDGAVLASDVLAAAQTKPSTAPAPTVPMAQSARTAITQSPITQSPITQAPTAPATAAIPMSRPWRIMAQRLQQSWTTVPHFYIERDVNGSGLVGWRKGLQARTGAKITYSDLMVKVVALALRRHSRLNASWQDEGIVNNTAINIGLAIAVEDGLLVPVIHQADQLAMTAIAERRAQLVERANSGKLTPADMADGTFTISNLGMFGIERFNAIVNPPQAAILAVGALVDRVVPLQGQPAVQPMMTLTLSADHRVVDGARAAQFLQTLVGYLEDPLSLLD